jgi:hypothetical protein
VEKSFPGNGAREDSMKSSQIAGKSPAGTLLPSGGPVFDPALPDGKKSKRIDLSSSKAQHSQQ